MFEFGFEYLFFFFQPPKIASWFIKGCREYRPSLRDTDCTPEYTHIYIFLVAVSCKRGSLTFSFQEMEFIVCLAGINKDL